jgi:hypothetical protein
MRKKLLLIIILLLIGTAGYFSYRYVTENPIKPQKIDENCPYYKDLLGRFVTLDQEIVDLAPKGENPWGVYSDVNFNDFRILKSTDGCLATDGKYFFNGIRKMADVDIETWKELENNYSKDKNNVYLYSEKLDGVDPATFEILNLPECGVGTRYTKDANNVYYNENVLESADPASFYVTCEYGLFLGKDAFSTFQDGRIIETTKITF